MVNYNHMTLLSSVSNQSEFPFHKNVLKCYLFKFICPPLPYVSVLIYFLKNLKITWLESGSVKHK